MAKKSLTRGLNGPLARTIDQLDAALTEKDIDLAGLKYRKAVNYIGTDNVKKYISPENLKFLDVVAAITRGERQQEPPAKKSA